MVHSADVARVVEQVLQAVERRRLHHGDRVWTRHEAMGVALEEWEECKDAVREDGKRYSPEDPLRAELLDLAVTCVWGIVSIDERCARVNRGG